MKITQLEEIIKDKTIAICGDYDTKIINTLSYFYKAKNFEFFIDKNSLEKPIENYKIFSKPSELTNITSDVCFLSGSAVKILFAKYPNNPQFLFVRLNINRHLLLATIGLIRRLAYRWVKVIGVARFIHDGNSSLWLVIQRPGGQFFKKAKLLLPSKVGIANLLIWLRDNNINYTILRFYDKLPSLYRVGGDLDILISDEDGPKLIKYIQSLSSEIQGFNDEIRLDVWFAGGVDIDGAISYYPPPLAKQVLKNAVVDKKSGARIPNSDHVMLTFAYHCLYHKGYRSGLPSKYKYEPGEVENDYVGYLQEKAKACGVLNCSSMEEWDEYLASRGWRPKRDTLAKISTTNSWVQDHHFRNKTLLDEGVIALIFKEDVFVRNIDKELINLINSNGYIIINYKKFDHSLKELVSHELRGGDWVSGEKGKDRFMPSAGLLLVDAYPIRFPNLKSIKYYTVRRNRILKEKIRKIFDLEKTSIVHTTDTTEEALEYADIMCPEATHFFVDGKPDVKAVINHNDIKNVKVDHLKLLDLVSRGIYQSLKNTVSRYI